MMVNTTIVVNENKKMLIYFSVKITSRKSMDQETGHGYVTGNFLISNN